MNNRPAGHARDNTQIASRSIQKGAAARGAAQKSPHAYPGTAAASTAACAPFLASTAGRLGAGTLKETPIASKLAGKLRLGCSQVLLVPPTPACAKGPLPKELLWYAKVSCSPLSGFSKGSLVQEALAKETAVECSPIWLPSPAPLRRRLEGALAMETNVGAAQHDVSRSNAGAAVIDIDLL